MFKDTNSQFFWDTLSQTHISPVLSRRKITLRAVLARFLTECRGWVCESWFDLNEVAGRFLKVEPVSQGVFFKFLGEAGDTVRSKLLPVSDSLPKFIRRQSEFASEDSDVEGRQGGEKRALRLAHRLVHQSTIFSQNFFEGIAELPAHPQLARVLQSVGDIPRIELIGFSKRLDTNESAPTLAFGDVARFADCSKYDRVLELNTHGRIAVSNVLL